MRDYITFSLCWDSGEADLTPKSKQYLEDLVSQGELWGMDVIDDMFGIMGYYHEKMSEAWIQTLVNMRKAANDAT